MYVSRPVRSSAGRALRGALAFAVALSIVGSRLPAVDAAPLAMRGADLATRDPNVALASNVAACDAVRARDVANSVVQLRSMQSLRMQPRGPETPESRNMLRDKRAYFHSLLEMEPRSLPTTSYHAMTPVEFATFRAAETAVSGGTSVANAMRACRSQAFAVSAVARTRDFQNCGGQPCGQYPPVLRVIGDSNGNFSNLYSSNNVPNSASGFNSSGSKVTSGTYSPVTISGLPGTNGSVPGWQHNLNLAGVAKFNISYATPSPAYVPQTGWTVIPGLKWKGNAVPMYLNPTASQPNVVVPLDSSNWLETYQTSPGVADAYYDFGTTGSSGTAQNLVFSAGANAIGTDLMDMGGFSMALGTLAATSTLFTVGVAASPLVVIGATVFIAGALIKWLFGSGPGGGGCAIAARRPFDGSPRLATVIHPYCVDDGGDDDDDDF